MKKFCVLCIIILSHIIIFGQEKKIDGIVAIIGNQIITEADINTLEAQAKSENQNIDRCAIIDKVMKEKMITYKAIEDTLIKVTNEDITKNVNSRKEYFLNELGSEDNLLKAFKIKTIAEFNSQLESIIKNQIYTQRKVSMITKNLDVSPEYVKNFYKNHENDLPYINEEVEISQILVYPKLTDSHKKEITDKLLEIKKEIQAGASFDEKAKEFSQDPGSASKGGLITDVRKGMMVKNFENAAFNLNEGDISDPIETEFGFHIIELVKKRGQVLDLKHILIKDTPTKEEINSSIEELKKVKTDISSDKISFNDAVSKYSEDKQSKFNLGRLYNPKSGDSKFEKLSLPTNVLYNISGLKSGDITDVFEDVDQRGKVVIKIIKVNNVIASHKMNLDEDYNRIKNFAKSVKEEEIIDQWVKSQIPTTFISLQKDYQDCKFSLDWKQSKK